MIAAGQYMPSVNSVLKIARHFHEKGDLQQAETHFLRVLQTEPRHAEALHAMGLIAYQLNQYDMAIDLIHRATESNPCRPEFYYNLGLVCLAQNRHDAAVRAFQKAIHIKHDYAEAYFNLALVFKEQGVLKNAIQNFKQAIRYSSDNADAYYNLGNIYKTLNQCEAAEKNYRLALNRHPNFAFAYNNLGLVLKEQGLIDEAINFYRKAVQLNSNFAEAHWNLSLALLLKGKFREGWKEHEWRFLRPKTDTTYPYHFRIPLWDGTPFYGKRIFVHSEQGLGDTLQFIRYLPIVKHLGGTVIFETFRPLLGLLNGFPGIDELVEISHNRQAAEKCDYYVPLMSLPFLFNTDAETIPAHVPYLRADSKKEEFWRSRLQTSGFKVGLVWAGKIRDNDNRPCPLEYFSPLAEIPGVQLFGLQKGAAATQLQKLPKGIILDNLGEEFMDFEDTAGAVENLDLIISIDTSVAHLVGAMGRQVWVLLPFAPDWRWLLNSEDSPWYPTMRLFRQPSPGDWHSVIECITEELRFLITRAGVYKSSVQKIDLNSTPNQGLSARSSFQPYTHNRRCHYDIL